MYIFIAIVKVQANVLSKWLSTTEQIKCALKTD